MSFNFPKEVHEKPVSLYRGISQEERQAISDSVRRQAEDVVQGLYVVSDDVSIVLPSPPLVMSVSVFVSRSPMAVSESLIVQGTQTEDSALEAIRALQRLPLGTSFEKLEAAGNKVLQLDPSMEVEVNCVYQQHFDYNRTSGFRWLQYTPYAEQGYANLRMARQIAVDLMHLDEVPSYNDSMTKADELLEFTVETPDSMTGYVSPEVSPDLMNDVRRHLDRSDLGRNRELDKQLFGMAYHMRFDSPLLLSVIYKLKDIYPMLVRDLINYQINFYDFTSPLYGLVSPSEQAYIDRLRHIEVGTTLN